MHVHNRTAALQPALGPAVLQPPVGAGTCRAVLTWPHACPGDTEGQGGFQLFQEVLNGKQAGTEKNTKASHPLKGFTQRLVQVAFYFSSL